MIPDLSDERLTNDEKKVLIGRKVWPDAHSSIPRPSLFLLVGCFHDCVEFLDNTYFVEIPSAIPNGRPRNLRGAASDYVIGEDWVHTEAVAWWVIEKVKQRFPDVYPDRPYVSWLMNFGPKSHEWHPEPEWTFDLRVHYK